MDNVFDTIVKHLAHAERYADSARYEYANQNVREAKKNIDMSREHISRALTLIAMQKMRLPLFH